jgi:hypothetical protein
MTEPFTKKKKNQLEPIDLTSVQGDLLPIQQGPVELAGVRADNYP